MPRTQEDYSILPVHLAVKSMRDSGYRNAAYAAAELVDNSLQAGARNVDVLCQETRELVARRRMARLTKIAVADDGSGMSPEILRAALQFGNGTHLNDRSGIGRFGMGLPNSSLSQARRVDVWTWQKGPDSAIHTYLDIDTILSQRMTEVPDPDPSPIPSPWREAINLDTPSGTLVVWSNLDRCNWKTGKAFVRNSEHLIGRMYRRFVADGRARIRMRVFQDSPGDFSVDHEARPNDPLYLMPNSSCPAPWDTQAMFEAHGRPYELEHEGSDGTKSTVTVRFSVARQKARQGHNPGARPHGKHAKHNIGISVMRADRELELQSSGWVIAYDPVERWWGIEVDFPPSLDEAFGVTNNKQCATHLADIAGIDIDEIANREGYESGQELQDIWKETSDPRYVLLKIKGIIESNLTTMREFLRAQTQRTKSRKRRESERPDPNSAEVKGTQATQKRKEEGHEGESDKDEGLPREKRVEDVAQLFEEIGDTPDEAKSRAEIIMTDGRKYEFVEAPLPGSAFFSVRPQGGVLIIQLNTEHPAYDNLMALVDDVPETEDAEKLRSRLHRTHQGLKLLLEAWARYEDELPAGKRKDQAQDARMDWGRVARDFLRED